MCYKIKTTHVGRYTVVPAAAVVAPAESLAVEVVLSKADALPKPSELRDRFLVTPPLPA